jgi:hypothetical protein
MAYAVLHSEKGKSGSGGIGNHIDRKKGMEHTFPHADPERINQNKVYKVHGDNHKLSLPDAINKRLEEGYTGKKAIRKDAVKFTTHVLTGSHEKMIEIFKDKDKANDWIQANYSFISEEFGKENIVRFNLHLDEKTPHIHVVTVPLTKDGRLSAREMFGNKSDMQKRQDRYAEKMKPFELQRGERRTGIKHEDAKAYYSRMNIANDVNSDDLIENKTILGFNRGLDKDKTIESFKIALNAQKTALKSNQLDLSRTKKQLSEVKRKAEHTSIKYERVLMNDNIYIEEQRKMIQEVQSKMYSNVKHQLNFNYKLHELNQEERKGVVLDLLVQKAKALGINQNIFKKSLSKDFLNKNYKVAEDRALRTEKRGRDRGKGLTR